jgi:hypothetical protein
MSVAGGFSGWGRRRRGRLAAGGGPTDGWRGPLIRAPDQSPIPRLARARDRLRTAHPPSKKAASERVFVPMTVGGGIRAFSAGGRTYSALEVASEYFR